MKLFLQFGHLIVLFLIILLAIISLHHNGKFERLFSKDTSTDSVIDKVDYDKDGITDYQDILEGAIKFISLMPKYKDEYYDGGYPSGPYYVSSDILWYSLQNAGYDFKKLLEEDIKTSPDKYGNVKVNDSSFRKIYLIDTYLKRNVESLSKDKDFYPGDIIVYKNDIAIISTKKNKDGIYYILHHDGKNNYEDDGLFREKIEGHYRWRLNK